MPLPLPRGARVPERSVWLNGHLVRGHDAALSVFDRGARAAGADEALLVSPAGEVLEGAASNLFVVRSGGDIVTPPLSADVLPGVTRALVIGLCAELEIPVREATVPLEMLRRAEEAFVT